MANDDPLYSRTESLLWLITFRLTVILIGFLFVKPVGAQEQDIILTVKEWEGYVSLYEQEFESWASDQGVNVDLVVLDGYITSPDDVFEALRLRSADIVTPTHNYYQSENAKLARVLLPLDPARISSFDQLFPVLTGAPFLRCPDGQLCGLPLLGGSYALAYNASQVPEPDSWNILLTAPAAGRYQLVGDQFEANIYLAGMLVGIPPARIFDFDRLTTQDLDAIRPILARLAAGSAGYWHGVPQKEQMRALDYVTDYWFGVAFANQDGQNWRIARPKEGQTVWLDTLAIGRHVGEDPKKLQAAYLLLSFATSRQVQIMINRAFGSVIVNKDAQAELQGRSPGPDFFVADLFWKPLTPRTRNAFRQMWAKAQLDAKGVWP